MQVPKPNHSVQPGDTMYSIHRALLKFYPSSDYSPRSLLSRLCHMILSAGLLSSAVNLGDDLITPAYMATDPFKVAVVITYSRNGQ